MTRLMLGQKALSRRCDTRNSAYHSEWSVAESKVFYKIPRQARSDNGRAENCSLAHYHVGDDAYIVP